MRVLRILLALGLIVGSDWNRFSERDLHVQPIQGYETEALTSGALWSGNRLLVSGRDLWGAWRCLLFWTRFSLWEPALAYSGGGPFQFRAASRAVSFARASAARRRPPAGTQRLVGFEPLRLKSGGPFSYTTPNGRVYTDPLGLREELLDLAQAGLPQRQRRQRMKELGAKDVSLEASLGVELTLHVFGNELEFPKESGGWPAIFAAILLREGLSGEELRHVYGEDLTVIIANRATHGISYVPEEGIVVISRSFVNAFGELFVERVPGHLMSGACHAREALIQWGIAECLVPELRTGPHRNDDADDLLPDLRYYAADNTQYVWMLLNKHGLLKTPFSPDLGFQEPGTRMARAEPAPPYTGRRDFLLLRGWRSLLNQPVTVRHKAGSVGIRVVSGFITKVDESGSKIRSIRLGNEVIPWDTVVTVELPFQDSERAALVRKLQVKMDDPKASETTRLQALLILGLAALSHSEIKKVFESALEAFVFKDRKRNGLARWLTKGGIIWFAGQQKTVRRTFRTLIKIMSHTPTMVRFLNVLAILRWIHPFLVTPESVDAIRSTRAGHAAYRLADLILDPLSGSFSRFTIRSEGRSVELKMPGEGGRRQYLDTEGPELADLLWRLYPGPAQAGVVRPIAVFQYWTPRRGWMRLFDMIMHFFWELLNVQLFHYEEGVRYAHMSQPLLEDLARRRNQSLPDLMEDLAAQVATTVVRIHHLGWRMDEEAHTENLRLLPDGRLVLVADFRQMSSSKHMTADERRLEMRKFLASMAPVPLLKNDEAVSDGLLWKVLVRLAEGETRLASSAPEAIQKRTSIVLQGLMELERLDEWPELQVALEQLKEGVDPARVVFHPQSKLTERIWNLVIGTLPASPQDVLPTHRATPKRLRASS